jgi:hypothetical protein
MLVERYGCRRAISRSQHAVVPDDQDQKCGHRRGEPPGRDVSPPDKDCDNGRRGENRQSRRRQAGVPPAALVEGRAAAIQPNAVLGGWIARHRP